MPADGRRYLNRHLKGNVLFLLILQRCCPLSLALLSLTTDAPSAQSQALVYRDSQYCLYSRMRLMPPCPNPNLEPQTFFSSCYLGGTFWGILCPNPDLEPQDLFSSCYLGGTLSDILCPNPNLAPQDFFSSCFLGGTLRDILCQIPNLEPQAFFSSCFFGRTLRDIFCLLA